MQCLLRPSPVPQTPALAPVGVYDLAINGYMRSGSSFTGRLLGDDPHVFYWYEPLWNYNSGVYYWGPNKVCPNGPLNENCGYAINLE